MPDPDLVCEVRTEGGTYRDWLTVTVAQSFDQAWRRVFQLTCAEPSQGLLARLLPKQRVDIAMAGKVIIQEGYITRRQVGYDANRHGVLIIGASKADVTTRVSADAGTGQFRGYKIDALANAVLKPLGLKFRLENPPEGADLPFPNVRIHHGETPFDFIQRLCRQRGLWVRDDKNGDLVAGVSDGGNVVFQEGLNILSANCDIGTPEVDEVIAKSQMPGSDSLFGKKVAEISAKAKMPDGIPGTKRKVLAEMPLTQKELQMRTDMEVQALEETALQVNLTYQGWLNPKGELWALSDWVTVKSPMLFPIEGGQMRLKLWGYAHTQTPEGQTTTTVDLRNARTFGQKNPDAQAPPAYDQPATPAQPETPT